MPDKQPVPGDARVIQRHQPGVFQEVYIVLPSVSDPLTTTGGVQDCSDRIAQPLRVSNPRIANRKDPHRPAWLRNTDDDDLAVDMQPAHSLDVDRDLTCLGQFLNSLVYISLVNKRVARVPLLNVAIE